ncbi:hypothetical protein EON81_04205 [bacterium]|nr:MAG: hypothetical protein EON81_04205 [bacterium]
MSILAFFKRAESLTLDEAMELHRLRLLRRERHTMRRMERAWRIAEAAINRDLVALLAVIANAESPDYAFGMGWIGQQERYTDLLATIGREIDRYAAFAATETTLGQERAIVAAIQEGHVAEKAALREAKVKGALARLDPAIMRHLVGTMSDGSPLTELFRTIGPAMVRKARLIFEEEVPKGTGSRKIGKRIEKELGTSRRRGETIARTEVNRCYRATRLESLRKRPDLWEGWMWQSALDKRTCPICWGMHGTVYGLDKDWPGSHPVCRCAMRPLAKGRVRKTEATGDEVFAKLDEKDQKAILLNPGRFEAYKSVGSLSGMVMDTRHDRWGTGKRLIPLNKLVVEK